MSKTNTNCFMLVSGMLPDKNSIYWPVGNTCDWPIHCKYRFSISPCFAWWKR